MAVEQAIELVRKNIDRRLILPYRKDPVNSYDFAIRTCVLTSELYDKCDLPAVSRDWHLSSYAKITLFSVAKPEVRLSLLGGSICFKRPEDWKAAWVYFTSEDRSKYEYLVHRLKLENGQPPKLTNVIKDGWFQKVETMEPSDSVLQAFNSIIDLAEV